MKKITLNHRLGDFTLNLDLQLPSEGITAIFGRSGSGKTTLIHGIAGLYTPNDGKIIINDIIVFDKKHRVNLPPEKRKIGFVFQEARLFPHMTTYRNLVYGMKSKTNHLLDEVIALLGIEHCLRQYPHQLSGGEKQRVAIGRALLTQPDLIIMDEPTASLDLPRRNEFVDYLLTLTSKVKTPILYVSHSLDEIQRIADHILVLEAGKAILSGKLVDVWTHQALRPFFSHQNVSALIYANFIAHHEKYSLSELQFEGQSLWLPKIDMKNKSAIRLRIFANDISIVKQYPTETSIRNILRARLINIECHHDKGECLLTFCVGQQTLLANITLWAYETLSLVLKDECYLQIKGVTLIHQSSHHAE